MSLIRSPVLEWRPTVRVRSVPGPLDARLPAGRLKRAGQGAEDRSRALEAWMPLRLIGQPPEVAQAIMLLADTDGSSTITTLIVDGPLLAPLLASLETA